MGAIADLWKSERGLVAIALIAACSVLFGLGYIPIASWTEYTKWIFVTYVAGKTITSSVGLATSRPEESDEARNFKAKALEMFAAYMTREDTSGKPASAWPPGKDPVPSPPTTSTSAA